jgi:biopolymer transport protein ExbD
MKDLLNIRLPQTQSSDGPQITTLGVVISKTGQILLNGNVITELQLIEEIKKAIKENKDTQAIISADIELSYGKVVKTIDLIKSAGLEKFALQIEKMVDEKPNSDVGNQK